MAGRKDGTVLFKGKAVTPQSAAYALNPPSKEDFALMRKVAEVDYPAAQSAAQLRGLFDATGDLDGYLSFCREQVPATATSGAEQGGNPAQHGKGTVKK